MKNNLLSSFEPDEQGHTHSVLVGNKSCYCMDCGKILLEYKSNNDFKKLLKMIEDFAKVKQ